eukprot:gene29962-52033_t
MVPCFEKPERADCVLAELGRRGLGKIVTPHGVPLMTLERVHTPRYLHFLRGAWNAWLALDPANAGKDAFPAVWPVRSLRSDLEPDNFCAKLGLYSMDSGTPITAGTWIAAKTQNIRLGAMFNVVPQWHPLRLAEDFATLHNLSGGRGMLGVGRGTVPREILHLNNDHISIGSHDNPDQASDDVRNREWFEEAMEVVRMALTEERFSFTGKYFQFPVPGIPDRGHTVTELTLIPRPVYPFEIWQAATSPPTV